MRTSVRHGRTKERGQTGHWGVIRALKRRPASANCQRQLICLCPQLFPLRPSVDQASSCPLPTSCRVRSPGNGWSLNSVVGRRCPRKHRTLPPNRPLPLVDFDKPPSSPSLTRRSGSEDASQKRAVRRSRAGPPRQRHRSGGSSGRCENTSASHDQIPSTAGWWRGGR